MKTLLLTATLLVASAGLVVCATDECTVSCEGHNPGDLVADPFNCTQYYVCLIDGTYNDDPIPCDPGTHFEDGKCQGTADCVPQCLPKDCNVQCKKPLDLVADPLDCNVYYVCDGNNKPQGPLHCDADKPYFNGENCVNSINQCCDDQCMPYCNTAGTQIIDPTDCHKFYLCITVGPVDPDLHFTCDSGQIFDIASGHCSANAKCVTLCETGGGGGGTTTPSGDCTSSMICPSSGYFPMCTFCYAKYFSCAGSSQAAVVKTCPGETLFDPVSHYCLENCPLQFMAKDITVPWHQLY